MKKIFTLLSFIFLYTSSNAQCRLFISEYVEGSSFNKALELYNPTPNPINLNGYQLKHYNSGSSNTVYTFNLSGIILANSTYVIVNSQASAALIAKADTVTGNSVLSFNGDDPIILTKGTDTLDAVGVWGNNITDTALLRNKTLVRNASISTGSRTWTVGATEWTVLNTDVEQLDSHVFSGSCPLPSDTVIQFLGTATSVGENSGIYRIPVFVNQPNRSSTITAEVEFVSSNPAAATLADIGNYTTTTLTFAPNEGLKYANVTITNDTIIEGVENFIFRIKNITGAATKGADSLFTLSILANDSIVPSLPFYTIDKIKSYDADGVADSLGVRCRTSGVVYGINTKRGSGFQFIISDHTGWIQVYSPVKTFGYTVNEGDSVVLQGRVDQFIGMTQMSFLDTVYKVGVSGLQNPRVITTAMNESMEASLIRVNSVALQNPAQWTNTGSGFTITVVKGGTNYRVRIDSLTSAYGNNAPTGLFDVIGWVSQFDSCNPSCLSFYTLNPRYSADIIRYNSIDEVGQNAVTVYPNPGTTNFQLLVNANNEQVTIKLYDVVGREVYAKESNVIDNIVPINNLDLGNGLYFGVMNDGGKLSKFKIEVLK